MSFVLNAVGDVLGGVTNVVKEVVDLTTDTIVDVVDFAVDEIITPVMEGVTDIGTAIMDDPITNLAKIAAIATGQAWWVIPLIDGASTLAKGGDLDDALEAAAISYATQTVGGTVSKFVNPEIAKAGFNSTATAAISGGVKGAATALIYGQDPLKAFATGGINAGLGAILGDIDTKLTNAIGDKVDEFGKPIVSGWENLQDGVKDSISQAVAAELEGGSISAANIGNSITKYLGVAKTMTKFLDENTGLDAAQAAVFTSALTNAATTALMGNPELSGEAFFAKIDEVGVASLKDIIDKPVNKAIDKVTGTYEKTEVAANALNEVMTTAADAADGFNALREDLNSRIDEQEQLKTTYNDELAILEQLEANAADMPYPDSAGARDAMGLIDTYTNDVATSLAALETYAETLAADYPDIKTKMDAFEATYDEYFPQIAALETAYTEESQYLMSDIDDLNVSMKPVFDDVTKVVALTLRPGFDEVAYREAYGLAEDADAYEHFLSQGQSLPTSKEAIDTTFDQVLLSVVQNSLAAKGVDWRSLEPEQITAITKYAINNVKNVQSITGIDFDAFANTAIELMNEATPFDAPLISSFPRAEGVTANDLATGKAVVTLEDGEYVWQKPEATAEKMNSGGVDITNSDGTGLSTQDYIDAMGDAMSLGDYTVTVRLAPNQEPLTLPDMLKQAAAGRRKISRALMTNVVDLGAEAGALLDEYVGQPIYKASKTVHDNYLSEGSQDAIGNAASVIAGAGGEMLQAIAGLGVILGANPNNALGRAAKSLLALSDDVQSDEWKAGAKDMQARSEDYDKEWREANPGKEPTTAQKGWLKAQSIWGNISEHPVQFIAENIVGEILQEVPIFLVSGGVGNVAKAALLKGGAAYSANMAAKVAGTKVGTALGLDMTEAFGGTAAGAFDETYATAIKMGLSEQEATDIAMKTAQSAGTTALLVTALTAGIGGQALAKSLLGDNASEFAGDALQLLGKKITDGTKVTVKEGTTEFIEEALPQLVTATINAQLDPDYDVAASVWENGFMGSISGTGVGATLYSGNAVADAALRLNSGVKSAMKDAGSAEEATTALQNLGITDTTILNNMLNSTYDTMYVSTNEAAKIFEDTNPNFVPTADEINSFVSNQPDSEVASLVASYIDERYLDADEVRNAALVEGIILTDDQIAGYVGQKNEADALASFTAEYAPQNTDPVIEDLITDPVTEDTVEDLITDPVTEDTVEDLIADPVVEDTVEDLITDPVVEDTVEDVIADPATADEVQDIVDGAIDNLPESASPEDVSAAISDALAGLENISTEEVQGIVDGTVAELTGDVAGLTGDVAGLTGDVAGLTGGVDELSDNLSALGLDLDEVAKFVGKPARNVTETDVDFVIDVIAQGNINAELTAQYDVTGDGMVDILDQNLLTDTLQGTTDTPLADTSMFNPATGLYLQADQNTQTQLDAITDMNTDINTQIDTQNRIQTREQNFSELQQLLGQSVDAAGQQVQVTPGDKVQLDYLYDIGGDSVFATQEQAGMFSSPFGGNRAGSRPEATSKFPTRTRNFAQGGQVEDENDRLLRLLGGM